MIHFPDARYRQYGKTANYWYVLARLATGRWSKGDDVRHLEERLEREPGIAHAIAVPKARVGIFLAVKALIEPGQSVVMSPYTISDVVNMVLCAGGKPVFADVTRETCNIDPVEIEKCIDANTGAVLITHLHGLSAELDRIVPLCEKFQIPLIEDAAQAFGTRYKDRQVGTFGTIGVFSFGQYKNVNSYFGGMLVTADAGLADKLRQEIKAFPFQGRLYFLSKMFKSLVADIATFPILFKTFTYWIFRAALLSDTNFLSSFVTVDQSPSSKRVLPESYLRRLTPTQAAIVEGQLASVDAHSKIRIANARQYHSALSKIRGIVCPPEREDLSHIYTSYPILVDDRDKVLTFMAQNYCDVAAQHLRNCAALDCFEDYYRQCPQADNTADSVILLPTYPRYGQGNIGHNIEVLQQYFAGSAACE
jgi:dTDP-4-amino-4,6-dideoxygalactose transaminase